MFRTKQTKRWASLCLMGLWGSLAGAQPSATSDSTTVQFDTAMQHFERCHWPQAFQQFAMLADADHDQAARIALLMEVHGTRLFGGRFTIDASRRSRWLDVAAARSPIKYDFAVDVLPAAQHTAAR